MECVLRPSLSALFLRSLSLYRPFPAGFVVKKEEKPALPKPGNDSIVKKPPTKIEVAYSKRKTVIVKTVELESDSITVDFYDNGTIDGDIVSIFFNGQAHTMQKKLTSRPFTVRIKLDPSREINEIGMFAENLGEIPPNTSLMVIRDTKRKYEILMSSTRDSNAVVRLKKATH